MAFDISNEPIQQHVKLVEHVSAILRFAKIHDSELLTVNMNKAYGDEGAHEVARFIAKKMSSFHNEELKQAIAERAAELSKLSVISEDMPMKAIDQHVLGIYKNIKQEESVQQKHALHLQSVYSDKLTDALNLVIESQKLHNGEKVTLGKDWKKQHYDPGVFAVKEFLLSADMPDDMRDDLIQETLSRGQELAKGHPNQGTTNVYLSSIEPTEFDNRLYEIYCALLTSPDEQIMQQLAVQIVEQENYVRKARNFKLYGDVLMDGNGVPRGIIETPVKPKAAQTVPNNEGIAKVTDAVEPTPQSADTPIQFEALIAQYQQERPMMGRGSRLARFLGIGHFYRDKNTDAAPQLVGAALPSAKTGHNFSTEEKYMAYQVALGNMKPEEALAQLQPIKPQQVQPKADNKADAERPPAKEDVLDLTSEIRIDRQSKSVDSYLGEIIPEAGKSQDEKLANAWEAYAKLMQKAPTAESQQKVSFKRSETPQYKLGDSVNMGKGTAAVVKGYSKNGKPRVRHVPGGT